MKMLTNMLSNLLPPTSGVRYPACDGLRGLAVLSVLVCSLVYAYSATRKTSGAIYYGNTSKLQTVMMKAEYGRPITIAYLGGSITQGSLVAPDEKYETLVSNWWKASFPESNITIINAGVGGSGSFHASQRVQKDVLRYNPDVVFVEHAVNDLYQKRNAKVLLQKIKDSRSKPAMVVLFFVADKDGMITNAEHLYRPFGKQYKIPMISFKKHVIPMLDSGDIQWHDFMTDDRHPNATGHKMAGDLITGMLDDLKMMNDFN